MPIVKYLVIVYVGLYINILSDVYNSLPSNTTTQFHIYFSRILRRENRIAATSRGDGLNTVQYRLLKTELLQFFTHILADIIDKVTNTQRRCHCSLLEFSRRLPFGFAVST